jgi:regulator of PEP synthase PpsR (kinase-PPPase family)
MHKAPAAENETTCTIVIDKQKKSDIREELHRLNVNEFTIYNDLEHLSKEIKKAWGIE